MGRAYVDRSSLANPFAGTLSTMVDLLGRSRQTEYDTARANQVRQEMGHADWNNAQQQDNYNALVDDESLSGVYRARAGNAMLHGLQVPARFEQNFNPNTGDPTVMGEAVMGADVALAGQRGAAAQASFADMAKTNMETDLLGHELEGRRAYGENPDSFADLAAGYGTSAHDVAKARGEGSGEGSGEQGTVPPVTIANVLTRARAFTSTQKDWRYKVDKYSQAKAVYEGKALGGDRALIVLMTQLLEPGMAVRADDEATLRNASGARGLLGSAATWFLKEGSLSDAQRDGIMQLSTQMMEAGKPDARSNYGEAEDWAARHQYEGGGGVNPFDVVGGEFRDFDPWTGPPDTAHITPEEAEDLIRQQQQLQQMQMPGGS